MKLQLPGQCPPPKKVMSTRGKEIPEVRLQANPQSSQCTNYYFMNII